MGGVEAIAINVTEILLRIIEEKVKQFFKMYEILKRHFVSLDLFREFLEKSTTLRKSQGAGGEPKN